MSDWVYEEEFGVRDGFRWCPDGDADRLLAFRHDRRRHLPDDQQHRLDLSLHHPDPVPEGRHHQLRRDRGRRERRGGATTWLQLPGDPREDYIPFMEWAGADSVLVQRMNRLQNHDALILASAATGGTRTDHHRDGPGLARRHRRHPVAQGEQGVPLAERAGRLAPRLCREPGHRRGAAADAGRLRRRTASRRWTRRAAGSTSPPRPDNATQQYLWRTRLDGKGKAERVTPAGAGRDAPLQRVPRRQVGHPQLVHLRYAAGHRAGEPPRSHGGARPGRQHRARRQGEGRRHPR